MGMQPILSNTVPVKKIKGAAYQCYGDGDGIAWCEQTLNEVIAIKSIIQFETLFSKFVLLVCRLNETILKLNQIDHFEIYYIQ